MDGATLAADGVGPLTSEILGRSVPSTATDGMAAMVTTRATERLALPLGVVALLVLWKIAAARIAAPFLLPDPSRVAASWLENRSLILWHAEATLEAVGLGFVAGSAMAAVLGYVISHSRALERLLTPYVVASQAVPIVAVAPLLVYWFRPGMPVKVTAAALIVFFPMLISTVVAFRNIPSADRELMHVMAAGRAQLLLKLEVPAALPYLLGGVRTGVTLSVIGAVVGEFLGSSRGLGTLLQITNSMFSDALMFAALVTLIVLALLLYGGAAALEHVLLRDR